MKERALELAKKLEWYSNYPEFVEAGEMIRRLVEELDRCKQSEKEGWRYADELEYHRKELVEELDKKQQGLVEASAMLFNYKYELDLERAMSSHLKEELEKHK